MSARSLGGATLTLRDGVTLVAGGGALLDGHTLVVADTHVATSTELRRRGYAMPEAEDTLLLERVRAMLALTDAKTLLVAGDFTHGPASTRAPEGGLSPLVRFVQSLPEVTLRVVLGNHDRDLASALSLLHIEFGTSLSVGAHQIIHGDDVEATRALRARCAVDGGRVLIGHVHPALVLDDGAGARATCPAFVTANAMLMLPALSPWARGGDVRSSTLRKQLARYVDDDPMGVAVVVGPRVLPIGNVFEMRTS